MKNNSLRFALLVIIGLIALLALLAVGCALGAAPTPPGGGGRIAFYSDRDGNDEIYVMNADGSGVTRLTKSSLLAYWLNRANDASPDWSPR